MPPKTGIIPPPQSTPPVEAKTDGKAAKKPQSKQKVKQALQEQAQHFKVLSAKLCKKYGVNAEEIKRTLSVDDMKTIIGWHEVQGDVYDIKDPVYGKKYVLLNNEGNRFLAESTAMDVAQDVLNRDWNYTAEPILIDKNGDVVSGQRRLVGGIFAELIRTGPQAYHWKQLWDGPITIEASIIYGVDSSAKVRRTVDNTRPKSVYDVLYTDAQLAKFDRKKRKYISRVFDTALRTVWWRTGLVNNPFHARKTVSELMSFKDRHPGILKAVLFLAGLDGEDRKISRHGRWVNLGTAAGLLYLMGMSGSDGDAYRRSKQRSERGLDKSMWDRAETFWTMLANCDKDDPIIRAAGKVRRPGHDPADRYSGFILKEGSTRERAALICKLWTCFVAKEEPSPKALKLEYQTMPTGVRLDSDPTVGGIDRGFVPAKPEDDKPVEELQQQMTEVATTEDKSEEVAVTSEAAGITEEATVSAPAPSPKATKQQGLNEEQRAIAQRIREENCQASGLTDSGSLD